MTPVVLASPERVAVGVETEDDEQYFRYTGVFAGPAGGPLEALAPFTDTARTHRINLVAGVGASLFIVCAVLTVRVLRTA